MSMKTKGAAALFGGILLMSLAGCASGAETVSGADSAKPASAPVTQTQEEACSIVEKEFAAYSEKINEKYDELSIEEMTAELLAEDQKGAVAEISRISDLVSNETVKAPLDELIAASEAAIPMMEKAFSDPTSAQEIMDSEEYKTLKERNAKATTDFDAVCPGAIAASVDATP